MRFAAEIGTDLCLKLALETLAAVAVVVVVAAAAVVQVTYT